MTTPAEAEEAYWRQQVIEGRRKQLDTVRKAATSWSGLFGAVVGVFGTVAFAGGLTSLDDLDEGLQTPMKWATLVAAALVLIATVLAGMAAGGSARKTDQSDWASERDRVKASAGTARTLLQVAKWFGAAGAVVVLVGSAVILLSGKAEPAAKKPPTVVAIVDGKAVCGKLKSGSGDTLMIGTTPLSSLTAFEVVDACP